MNRVEYAQEMMRKSLEPENPHVQLMCLLGGFVQLVADMGDEFEKIRIILEHISGGHVEEVVDGDDSDEEE